jgi:hypothetical protein
MQKTLDWTGGHSGGRVCHRHRPGHGHRLLEKQREAEGL